MLMLVVIAVLRPAAQEPVVPDPAAFLREVRDNLTRSQQLTHRYAYRERRTDFHLNPFGRLGAGGTRVLQVYPSANRQLTERRVIERNGVAVSKQELDRQAEEHRAKVAAVERRFARDPEGRREQQARDEEQARRRAQATIQDVVDVLDFQVARRDVRDGVASIVITFTPKPAAKPQTRQGRYAKVFKGNVWVQEATHEVTHVEAVSIDDVAFGGFLGKVYEGTRAAVERRQIEPGVWMPTRVMLSGGARALFRKLKIEYVIEWFEYQKLPIPNSQLPN